VPVESVLMCLILESSRQPGPAGASLPALKPVESASVDVLP
jgi:hypothetical protein